MVKKTPNGSFIISAGELAAYSVCPVSWELRSVKRVKGETAETSLRGDELHKQWARSFEEAHALKRQVWYVALVIIVLMLLVALG